MRSTLLLMAMALIVILSVATAFAAQNSQASKEYNPQITYAGQYKANLLFWRYRPGDYWRRNPKRDRLSEITCQEALAHLKSEGKWTGCITPYGSCGVNSGECPEWALGNRINFDEALQQKRAIN